MHISSVGPAVLPRLFAIDMDGTLLTSSHELTESTIKAIHHVRAHGAQVILASSRPPSAMWPYLQRLALVDPAAFIACQGAVIGAYSPDGALRLIKQERIPLHLALASVALATAAGLPVNWYSGESWYVSDYDEGIERESQVVGLRPIVRRLSRESVGPDKLLVISPADRPDVEVLLGALPDGLVFQQSNHGYFEITSKGTDKGFAVASYAREAGIRTEEVVAIGDGPNDLGMFSIAGVSIAPSNASEAALTAADYITDSNDDNGVATALRAMLP